MTAEFKKPVATDSPRVELQHLFCFAGKLIRKCTIKKGTVNVLSWSRDSRNIAFVSYRLVHLNPVEASIDALLLQSWTDLNFL